MDVTSKIKQILKQRGWSAYRLAKESGLSESTIANIIKRNAIPSVDTLEAICNGMGITIAGPVCLRSSAMQLFFC